MVFDSKINDENLTKCLQTLKELYADMEDKHGLFCPCEAEFRAYIVLMNLNEGDTLRSVGHCAFLCHWLEGVRADVERERVCVCVCVLGRCVCVC